MKLVPAATGPRIAASVLCAMVLAVAGLWVAVFATSGVAADKAQAAPAAVFVAASVFVSTTGSDAAACTQAAPCRTFQVAYQHAQAGQTVEVAAGSYPQQNFDIATKATAEHVVFRPAAGATVNVNGIDVTRLAHVDFLGINYGNADTYFRQAAQDIHVDSYHAGLLFIRGSDNIVLTNCDYGPNDSNEYMNWITEPYQSSDAAQNDVVDHCTIHDFTRAAGSAAHVDCLGVGNSDNLRVTNSRFYNCEAFAIIPGLDPSGRYARNMVIENNFIQCCRSGFYGIGLGDVSGALIRFNSLSGAGIGWLGGTNIGTVVDSNVIEHNNSGNCSSATWRYNVIGDNACGGTNRVGAASFVGPPTDLHLRAGAAAIDAGNPSSFPGLDIDGQTRPAGSAPDAGADEAGGTVVTTTTTTTTATTTTTPTVPTTTTVPTCDTSCQLARQNKRVSDALAKLNQAGLSNAQRVAQTKAILTAP